MTITNDTKINVAIVTILCSMAFGWGQVNNKLSTLLADNKSLRTDVVSLTADVIDMKIKLGTYAATGTPGIGPRLSAIELRLNSLELTGSPALKPRIEALEAKLTALKEEVDLNNKLDEQRSKKGS